MLVWTRAREPRDSTAQCTTCSTELHPTPGILTRYLTDTAQAKHGAVMPDASGRTFIRRYCTLKCAPQPDSDKKPSEGGPSSPAGPARDSKRSRVVVAGGRKKPTCDGHKECEFDCKKCDLWTGATFPGQEEDEDG